MADSDVPTLHPLEEGRVEKRQLGESEAGEDDVQPDQGFGALDELEFMQNAHAGQQPHEGDGETQDQDQDDHPADVSVHEVGQKGDASE